MADPSLYLPSFSDNETIQRLLESLKLPRAKKIEPLRGRPGAYHAIYILTFEPDAASKLLPAGCCEPDSSIELVLRVSGTHLPHIKTINEVAVMAWIQANTNIPIASVVRYDASTRNPLSHEFTLLEKIPGISVDQVYDRLDTLTKRLLVERIADIVTELFAHDWNHIGGLSFDEESKVVPGRPVEETFWQAPEIGRYWDASETIDSLNISGLYSSYTAYLSECMRRYTRNINQHPSLASVRDMVPRLESFIEAVTVHASELNNTKYMLSQMDMHFGNIMFEPSTGRITSILDWEFAEVVPAFRQHGGFLWKGQEEGDWEAERIHMKGIFADICTERGLQIYSKQASQTSFKRPRRLCEIISAPLWKCSREARSRTVPLNGDGWQRKH